MSETTAAPYALRRFEFSEGSSDKFWSIQQNGASLAIRFGRIGTDGQAQDKSFGTEEEAAKAAEKLIAEKTKKGYAEVAGTASSAAVVAKLIVATAKSVAAAAPKATPLPAVVEAVPAASPAPRSPVGPAETRIALDPADWFRAPWRNLQPLPKPDVRPFDLKASLDKLAKLPVLQYGWRWNWGKAGLSYTMSREEAAFWFTAMVEGTMTAGSGKTTPQVVAEKLTANPPAGVVTPEQMRTVLNGAYEGMGADAVLILLSQLPPLGLIRALLDREDELYAANPGQGRYSGSFYRGSDGLLEGLHRWALPYLTPVELQEIQEFLRPRLDISTWPTDNYQAPRLIFPLAAVFGLSAELRPLVEGWASDLYSAAGWDPTHYHHPQQIVFGLGSAAEVHSQMRRLNLPLKAPEDARAWLAHTERAELDYLKDVILEATNKEEADGMLEILALVEAPETAPLMLELMLNSRAPRAARHWLNTHTAHAVTGLLPLAGGRGKWADAAVEFLRGVRRQGEEALIEAGLPALSSDAAARVRSEVLASEDTVPFDDATTPGWLSDAMASSTKTKVGWVSPADLPLVTEGKQHLNAAQTTALLGALAAQKAPLDPPHPLVSAVKAHVDAASRDAFAWQLFDRWRSEGAPSKERWALMAVGLLGTDVSALKLTPLIRSWPGESQHTRAVMGLEVLRAIGTDLALMQINGIAQKVAFKGLKASAVACMEGIASDRNLTRSELEDRIVPDCDLDEHGSRVFDFGPRSFRLVLGGEMKPLVKDSDGKVKPDLPKPNSKDDAAKAEQAVADWKLLKKQVAEVAKTQAHRLEQAMVTGRRWTKAEFETLLVRHPLMINLVRLLVWGVFDDAGLLTGSFRVTEDQTYADSADALYTLPEAAQVGIVHPLILTEDERSAWGEVFSDYELVAPFPQIGRAIFVLEPGEAEGTEIKRFPEIKIPSTALVFTLEKQGWTRGMPQDAGVFSEHSKPFEAANITAVIEYPGVPVGYMEGWEDQTLENCFFLAGRYKSDWTSWRDRDNKLPLREIDPVVLSEVLSDLALVASKGK